VQAAWPIAWRKLASLRDEDRLRPWLVSIAANEARQLIRRRRRRRAVEIAVGSLDTDPGSRDDRADEHDRSLDVLAALGRLPPDDRGLVAMRYAFGLTSAEIGRAMNLSAPGVRYRLAHALERLRKDLGDD
jgi:RNA polymerase sigma-70 factor, ECF subfamily